MKSKNACLARRFPTDCREAKEFSQLEISRKTVVIALLVCKSILFAYTVRRSLDKYHTILWSIAIGKETITRVF